MQLGRRPGRAPGEWSAGARRTGLFILVAGGYVLGYELATRRFDTEHQVASFFPPAGVTLAALVLVARRDWPVVLAAAAAAELVLNVTHGIDLAPSVGYTLANTLEPLTGALLLTLLVDRVDLRRTRHLAALVGCAVIAAPVVGAAIGATTFVALDDGSGWPRFALEWWAGDGLGVLVVGSAILSLRDMPRMRPRRAIEGAVLAALAITATALVFEFGWFPFVYLPVALLIVLAFRVGTAGVAVTSAIVAFIAAARTAEATAFWDAVDISPQNRILYLQLALGVLIAALLALAAEISEREQIAIRLARTESERVDALERAELAERESRARRHAESLARSAAELARSSTVDEVARTAVSVMSDWGIEDGAFELVQAGQLVRLAGSREDVPEDGVPAPVSLSADEPGAQAVRDRSPVIAEIPNGLPQSVFRAAGRRAPPAVAAFPVVAGGTVAGVLRARLPDRDWLTEDRRNLLASLADHAGLALLRAQLQAEADAAAEDAALLALLGETLERGTGLQDRARALVQTLTATRASLAVVHALDELGEPRPLAQMPADLGERDVDELALAALAADALAVDRAATASLGRLTVIAVPLRARDRALGVLTVGFEPVHGAVQVTTLLVQRIATRAALAFDNAILYEHERNVSHSLQMGLLGGDLAVTPATAIASAYRPGTAALEVGGDWYDAFTVADGALALLVGDVVGHGLEAAVAMGQLRGAVRALGPTGSPKRVLEALDTFVEELPAAAMATLAYAVLDLDEGRLTYACAGHPPPLLVPMDGPPRLLWEGRSTPLGSSFAGAREEAVDWLAPGDTIVLYTDGLVERRTDGMSAGLDALLEVASRAAGDEPSTLVDRILESLLVDETLDDDVCVLAVRRVPANVRFARSFVADRGEVAAMRRAFTSWLEQLDVAPELRRDAVLALSEAAANAAEHAYSFDRRGVVRVEALVTGNGLQLSVRDHGTWRRPRPQTERGRGLTIIEALTQDVRIDRTANGTTVRMRVPMNGEFAP